MSQGPTFGSKRAVAAMSLTGPLDERMRAIADAGFAGIELHLDELSLADMTPQQIGRRASDLGLSITCLQGLGDYEGATPARRSGVRDMARRALDRCGELDVHCLCVTSNTRQHVLSDWDCIAEDIAWLADEARSYGVSLGYEPVGWGAHIAGYGAAMRLIDIVDRDNLGITLDCFHWFAKDQPLSLLAVIPARKIAYVQLADGQRDPALDFLQLNRFHRMPLGEGRFPILEFLRILKGTGYRGPLSIEILNPDRFGLSNSMLALWYRESLDASISLVDAEGITEHAPMERTKPCRATIA